MTEPKPLSDEELEALRPMAKALQVSRLLATLDAERERREDYELRYYDQRSTWEQTNRIMNKAVARAEAAEQTLEHFRFEVAAMLDRPAEDVPKITPNDAREALRRLMDAEAALESVKGLPQKHRSGVEGRAAAASEAVAIASNALRARADREEAGNG